MTVHLTISELLEYTDWQRQKWLEWLRQHGDALALSAGPHRDGRFESVGDLIRHVFSAEKRYVDRLSDRPITDTAGVSSADVEALFELGRQSRADLREFVARYPAEQWDAMQEMSLFNSTLRATTRKIIVHVLLHEVRHWAQIATICRLNGLAPEMQDFIVSPVMGGELRRATPAQ